MSVVGIIVLCMAVGLLTALASVAITLYILNKAVSSSVGKGLGW